VALRDARTYAAFGKDARPDRGRVGARDEDREVGTRADVIRTLDDDMWHGFLRARTGGRSVKRILRFAIAFRAPGASSPSRREAFLFE
jgi:hypothetical protein